MIIQTFFDKQVQLIQKDMFLDNRGWFLQSYDDDIKQIINHNFEQENLSYSKNNVFRGLHYQWDKPMGKLIQCVNGSVIDVVLDIRKESTTLGKIEFFNLDSPNKILWIPAGFAHGFYSETDHTVIKYMCSSKYNKNTEGCINLADKNLKILQSLKLNIDKLIISDKDRSAQSFEDYLKQPKF